MSDGASFRFHANGDTAWIHKFSKDGTTEQIWTFSGNGDFKATGDVQSSKGASLNSLIPVTASVSLKAGFSTLNVNRVTKSGRLVLVNVMVTIISRIPKDQDTVLGTIPSGFRAVSETAGNFVTTTGVPVNSSVFSNGEIRLYPKNEVAAGQVLALNFVYAVSDN